MSEVRGAWTTSRIGRTMQAGSSGLAPAEAEPTLQILVRSACSKHTVVFWANRASTVHALRLHLDHAFDDSMAPGWWTPPGTYRLMHKSRVLQDGRRLTECGVGSLSTVHVIIGGVECVWRNEFRAWQTVWEARARAELDATHPVAWSPTAVRTFDELARRRADAIHRVGLNLARRMGAAVEQALLDVWEAEVMPLCCSRWDLPNGQVRRRISELWEERQRERTRASTSALTSSASA